MLERQEEATFIIREAVRPLRNFRGDGLGLAFAFRCRGVNGLALVIGDDCVWGFGDESVDELRNFVGAEAEILVGPRQASKVESRLLLDEGASFERWRDFGSRGGNRGGSSFGGELLAEITDSLFLIADCTLSAVFISDCPAATADVSERTVITVDDSSNTYFLTRSIKSSLIPVSGTRATKPGFSGSYSPSLGSFSMAMTPLFLEPRPCKVALAFQSLARRTWYSRPGSDAPGNAFEGVDGNKEVELLSSKAFLNGYPPNVTFSTGALLYGRLPNGLGALTRVIPNSI